jgi:hypothetical protein
MILMAFSQLLKIYEILVGLPMPFMYAPSPAPPANTFYKFMSLGNLEILFSLARLHRLNLFAVAAVNVLSRWI